MTIEAFVELTAQAVPVQVQNVDTDQIIPARFLTRKRTEGMPNFCFRDLRYTGEKKNDIPLNDPRFADAQILVAGQIFGSGSSRESAVWALVDRLDEVRPSGFRCVIAETFGDIFFNNASKNGLLPVRLPVALCTQLQEQLLANPEKTMYVSLEKQIVRFPNGEEHSFEIDEFRKACLLRGVDDVSLTKELEPEFLAFETKFFAERPWLAGGVAHS